MSLHGARKEVPTAGAGLLRGPTQVPHDTMEP